MNDVIRGKIIHMAKMATKDDSSVDVDFALLHCYYFLPVIEWGRDLGVKAFKNNIL